MAFGEDKKQRKAQELMEKYGLETLTDPSDYASVQKIAQELAGRNLIEVGAALQFKAEEAAKLGYLRALIEQNFIIIRQLDRLNAWAAFPYQQRR